MKVTIENVGKRPDKKPSIRRRSANIDQFSDIDTSNSDQINTDIKSIFGQLSEATQYLKRIFEHSSQNPAQFSSTLQHEGYGEKEITQVLSQLQSLSVDLSTITASFSKLSEDFERTQQLSQAQIKQLVTLSEQTQILISKLPESIQSDPYQPESVQNTLEEIERKRITRDKKQQVDQNKKAKKLQDSIDDIIDEEEKPSSLSEKAKSALGNTVDRIHISDKATGLSRMAIASVGGPIGIMIDELFGISEKFGDTIDSFKERLAEGVRHSGENNNEEQPKAKKLGSILGGAASKIKPDESSVSDGYNTIADQELEEQKRSNSTQKKQLSELIEVEEEAQEQSEKNADEIQSLLKKILRKLDPSLFDEVKDSISDVVGGAAGGAAVGKAAGKFGKLGGLFGKLGSLAKKIPGIGKIGAAIGGAGALAKKIPGIGKIGSAVGGLAKKIPGGKIGAAAKTLAEKLPGISKIGNIAGGLTRKVPGIGKIAGAAGKLLGKSGAVKEGVSTGIKTALPAVKGIGKIFGKVPVIGTLALAGLDMATGEKATRAIGGAAGTMAGGWAGAAGGASAGAAIGSVVPGVGTAIGGIVGSIIGGVLGGIGGEKLGKGAVDLLTPEEKVERTAKDNKSIADMQGRGILKSDDDKYDIALSEIEKLRDDELKALSRMEALPEKSRRYVNSILTERNNQAMQRGGLDKVDLPMPILQPGEKDNILEGLEKKGILDQNYLGKSELDVTRLDELTASQLKALEELDDFSEDVKKAIKEMLSYRLSGGNIVVRDTPTMSDDSAKDIIDQMVKDGKIQRGLFGGLTVDTSKLVELSALQLQALLQVGKLSSGDKGSVRRALRAGTTTGSAIPTAEGGSGAFTPAGEGGIIGATGSGNAGAGYGNSIATTSVDEGTKGLLNRITAGEGTSDVSAQRHGFESGYDVMLGYGKYGKGDKPLTQMTVGEVKDLQKQLIANSKGQIPGTSLGSSAVGKYQVISGTLAAQQQKLGFKDTDLFDANLQDKIGQSLLEGRGYKEFREGKISANEFQRNLANEWASIADPNTGKSRYGQHTGTSNEQIASAMDYSKANRGVSQQQMQMAAAVQGQQTGTPVSGNNILAAAESKLGMGENNQAQGMTDYLNKYSGTMFKSIAGDVNAWCARFVSATLESQGIKSTKSSSAASYLDYGDSVWDPKQGQEGLSKAKPGDVAVFSRKGGSGNHVAIVKSVDPKTGKVTVVGGNQKDAVTVSERSMKNLKAIRRAPGTDTIKTPAQQQQEYADAHKDKEREDKRDTQVEQSRQQQEPEQEPIEYDQGLPVGAVLASASDTNSLPLSDPWIGMQPKGTWSDFEPGAESAAGFMPAGFGKDTVTQPQYPGESNADALKRMSGDYGKYTYNTDVYGRPKNATYTPTTQGAQRYNLSDYIFGLPGARNTNPNIGTAGSYSTDDITQPQYPGESNADALKRMSGDYGKYPYNTDVYGTPRSIGGVTNMPGTTIGNATGAVGGVMGGISQGIGGILGAPGQVIGGIQQGISGILSNPISAIGQVMGGISNVLSIPNQIKQGIGGVVGQAKSIPGQVTGTIGSIPGQIKNIPGSIMGQIGQIGSMGRGIGASFPRMGLTSSDTAQSSFGPSLPMMADMPPAPLAPGIKAKPTVDSIDNSYNALATNSSLKGDSNVMNPMDTIQSRTTNSPMNMPRHMPGQALIGGDVGHGGGGGKLGAPMQIDNLGLILLNSGILG